MLYIRQRLELREILEIISGKGGGFQEKGWNLDNAENTDRKGFEVFLPQKAQKRKKRL